MTNPVISLLPTPKTTLTAKSTAASQKISSYVNISDAYDKKTSYRPKRLPRRPGRNVVLNYPEDIIVGVDQDLYFSEAINQRVRMFDFRTNATRTIPGFPRTKHVYTGAEANTHRNNPKGIVRRGADGFALYVTDFYNDMIDKVMLRQLSGPARQP